MSKKAPALTPMRRRRPENRVPKPKSLREVPRYLGLVLGGFFKRFFYIFRLVWEAKPSLTVAMMLFAVLNGVLPVVGAYISAELIGEISRQLHLSPVVTGGFWESVGANFSLIFLLLIATFLHQLLTRILGRLSHMVNSMAGELIVNHIKLKILHKAKTVDMASFDRPEFYEKMENANREASHRPLQIMNATFTLFSTVISALSFVVILVGLHPAAPWLIVLLALPGAIVNYVYRNKNFWFMRYRSKERREMNYFSGVVVDKDKAKEMRIMGLSDTFIDRYETTFKKYYRGLRRLILQEGFWQILSALVSLAGHCAIFLYVAYQVIYGGAGDLAEYSLYTTALTSIHSYVGTLLSSTATIYEGTLFIDNMIVFLAEKTTVVPSTEAPKVPQRHVPHTITFDHVSFRYPGTDRDVIHDVTMQFEPGESVVLVGLNGAGKTTLIKLMTRLYDPTEGRILLDGIDLREYDVRALYDLFGIIFQDFGKYAVSVRENITFGDISVDTDEEKVKSSARQSAAKEFIDRLPLGYDTPLMRIFEEDGLELSIGQWQKLSVARAFYKDSDILILDEPTASLDALAEQEIYDQFASLSKDKTTVFVSHRLSSATTASRIVVLEHGRLVEMGTHDQLMAAKGQYFKLFSTQAKRYTGVDYEAEESEDPPPSADLIYVETPKYE